MNEQGQGSKEFDISGSPAKPQEEQVKLSTRSVKPTERRMATPERAPGGNHKPEKTPEMQFEDDAGPSDAGGAGSSDSMIGFFRGLNIVDITEVFSPQGSSSRGSDLDSNLDPAWPC